MVGVDFLVWCGLVGFGLWWGVVAGFVVISDMGLVWVDSE